MVLDKSDSKRSFVISLFLSILRLSLSTIDIEIEIEHFQEINWRQDKIHQLVTVSMEKSAGFRSHVVTQAKALGHGQDFGWMCGNSGPVNWDAGLTPSDSSMTGESYNMEFYHHLFYQRLKKESQCCRS